MTLTLYFLRHGETFYSKTGGYCGSLDPDLTEHGMKMADQFAAAYAKLPWEAVYCSPMKRTIATAKPLCEAAGVELQLRDGLKELYYGKWEGLSLEEINQNYRDDYVRWLTEPAWNPPTEGETAVKVASRASLVLAEIEAQHSHGKVLVVSHKATIRIMLCGLLGIDLGRYRDRINALAGSISVVKFGEHGPLLDVLGDRSYMDEELRNLQGT